MSFLITLLCFFFLLALVSVCSCIHLHGCQSPQLQYKLHMGIFPVGSDHHSIREVLSSVWYIKGTQ